MVELVFKGTPEFGIGQRVFGEISDKAERMNQLIEELFADNETDICLAGEFPRLYEGIPPTTLVVEIPALESLKGECLRMMAPLSDLISSILSNCDAELLNVNAEKRGAIEAISAELRRQAVRIDAVLAGEVNVEWDGKEWRDKLCTPGR